MARRWSRKRRASPDGATSGDDPVEPVRLDAVDNAWWSQAEVEQAWSPQIAAPSAAPPERDILAEHFGDDWRTNLGFDSAVEDREPAPEADSEDPYAVLRVAPTSTWDEIVAAHRHEARVHHPDGLFGRSEEEKAEGEEHIRRINAAYQELRIRRGM